MSTPAIRAIAYPCRCLCLGLVQMTMTVPCRRMTLQLSQRALTEALTFTGSSCAVGGLVRLLESVGDPAAGQVVGRKLYPNPVAGQDPDEVHPELPADMSQDAVAVLQLDREHRVGQRLDDRSLDFDRVLLGHRLLSFPFSRRVPAHEGRHTNAQHIKHAHFRQPRSSGRWRRGTRPRTSVSGWWKTGERPHQTVVRI